MQPTGFLPGTFDIEQPVRDLDQLAESLGWMAEPRDMSYIRRSPWYRQSISHFLANATPQSFTRRPPQRVTAHHFIFWRILDWGCGLNTTARAWLDQHTGHSITYALRTGDIPCMEKVYQSHMQGPWARVVGVVAPAITHRLDYAERLFSFHPASDIAVLLPFLVAHVRQADEGIGDAVYFLSRAVRFLLLAGAPGKTLLDPHIPAIQSLSEHIASLHDHPLASTPSAYSDRTVLEEARYGIEAIRKACDESEPKHADYLCILDVAMLDVIYDQVYGVPLREHVAANYEIPDA